MPVQYATQTMVKDMLSHIKDDRMRCAALMQYLHGMRANEVLSLRVKDTEGGHVRIRRFKGSHPTLQNLLYAPSDPLLDEVGALKTLVAKYQLGPDSLLFGGGAGHRAVKVRDMKYNTYLNTVKAAAIAAGWPPALAHTHTLKHSIAMHLVERIDLKDLQVYLGHKSLSSTGIYLESNDVKASAAVARVFAEEEK